MTKDVENGKICAILLYIFWLVGIIWYFADENMRKNAFAKYHARQSIALVIMAFAIGIGLWIVSFILFFIPILGWRLMSLIWFAFWILMLVFIIMGIIHAAKGETKPLPVIGKFGEKISI